MSERKYVTRADLTRSIKACHRIEDAIGRKLDECGLTERSPAADVCQAVALIRQYPAGWCERAAWERIADSFVSWATIYGTLERFWQLRRKREARDAA